MPRRFSGQELLLIEEIRALRVIGARPSELLHYLARKDVRGVNLIVLMEAAFPGLRSTNVISVWDNQSLMGTPNDDQIDRRLEPFMPVPRQNG